MRVKRYICPTLPDAMAQIREDLGDEAVILGSENLPDGQIQVTAGLDGPDDSTTPQTQGRASDVDFLDRVTDVLEFHRLPQALINNIVETASEQVTQDWHLALAQAFEQILSFSALPDGPRDNPLMFVGPPGDGKTATIAKICARQFIRGRKTAVITLDGHKTGGFEQISAFCTRLNADLERADTPDDLCVALARRQTDELVLIDCFGVNPFDNIALDEVRTFTEATELQSILILCAGGDPYEMADKANAFATLGTRHFIPTKLDIAHRYGGILTAALTAKLAMMATGTSPQIADGLTPINASNLAHILLSRKHPKDDLQREAGEGLLPRQNGYR